MSLPKLSEVFAKIQEIYDIQVKMEHEGQPPAGGAEGPAAGTVARRRGKKGGTKEQMQEKAEIDAEKAAAMVEQDHLADIIANTRKHGKKHHIKQESFQNMERNKKNSRYGKGTDDFELDEDGKYTKSLEEYKEEMRKKYEDSHGEDRDNNLFVMKPLPTGKSILDRLSKI